MDFHRSAEELQTLRRKLTQAEMPCRSGPKDSVADSSEEQAKRLEEQLDKLQHVLSEERILRKGNISVGKWNNEKGLVEIFVAKGVHWNVFGKNIQGQLVLQPEEALYMLDHGMLELFHDGLPVSVHQAYELLLSDGFPLYHYIVYCYLRNLGFIVFRHERTKENVAKNAEMRSIGAHSEDKRINIDTDKELLEKSMEIETIDDARKQTMKEGSHENLEKMERKIEEKTKEEVDEGSVNVENVEDVKGKSEKIEGDIVESQSKQIEGKSEGIKGSIMTEETKNNEENSPVQHYWKGEECKPLVHPSDATSLENIFSKLKVIKGHSRQEASQQASCKFHITYDVFQPQKNFKKTDPGLPNHSICVCKFSEPPPSIGEMNYMANQSYPVPLKYAVVEGRDVSFYSILDVELPTYFEG